MPSQKKHLRLVEVQNMKRTAQQHRNSTALEQKYRNTAQKPRITA